MQPFECYKMYLALKNHFETPSYDFFRYNGKVSATFDSFCARRDKYQFSKLSKKDDVRGFILANLIAQKKISWVGDLLSDDAEENFKRWQKRQQSLTYTIKEDLSKFDDLKQAILVKNGQHPDLLKLFLQKKVCVETLIVIDRFTNIFQYWNEKINDPVVWPTVSMLVEKYKPFFKFDKEKIKPILKEKMNTG